MTWLHRLKYPRQMMPWVLVIILLACTLLPASAAAPRAAGSGGFTETWKDTFVSSIEARYYHTAVWTGTEMIVWGGVGDGNSNLHTGGRYNPATGAWRAISTVNAPTVRYNHIAVWTGKEMIIWGGVYGEIGGRYNPVTDTWASVSTTNAPSPAARVNHTAVWTGTEMIVWGGFAKVGDTYAYLNTGGRYNPANDTWDPIPMSTDNAPTARECATAVWTGGDAAKATMVIWGGRDDSGVLNNGGRYNPANNTWETISTDNAPVTSYRHTALWTGTEMLVWSGGIVGKTGGRYNPASDTWNPVPMSTVGAPTARSYYTAVWAGTKMIIWGGEGDGGIVFDSGGIYDPQANRWTATALTSAPAARHRHTAVWTGTEMITWGGDDYVVYLSAGGRYNPITDTWTAEEISAAPVGRNDFTTVWTGSEMIIWGGGSYNPCCSNLNTGGRYNPRTNTWAATSTANAPVGRWAHAAAWTGTEMIVWGGYGSDPLNTGGRYNPATNTWKPMSTDGAPEARAYTAAVWTGKEVLIWGGRLVNTGGRYDPQSDNWKSMSTVNAPSPRLDYSVVWTGTEMLIWGGHQDGTELNTGARYDPEKDEWKLMTIDNAPEARYAHTAVWTGTEMIIWGGSNGNNFIDLLNTGARYNPADDTWRSIPLSDNTPAARAYHTAVWTGSGAANGEMLVWGGSYLNTGARYDPSKDTWTPITMTHVPSARTKHAAVWTGTEMLVWGGTTNQSIVNTGGRYSNLASVFLPMLSLNSK